MMMQAILYTALALYGLMMYGLLVSYTRTASVRSWWVAPLCVWLSSMLPIAFLALQVEKRSFGDLVRFREQAWSFLIGDTVVLPLIAVTAALGWLELRTRLPQRRVRGNHKMATFSSRLLAGLDIGTGKWWGVTRWWTASCLLVGIVGGVAFHWADGQNYKTVGAGAALLSPTKVAHDLFVAYPVLLGWAFCAVLPLLVRGAPRYRWLLGALLLVMMVLMGADMTRGLNPHDMHPLWDPVRFSVIRS